ncbi:TonB-dependent receptor domain-containing protein [Microvirga sp. 2MCAF35]|uniref:TonB-dependent receptor domain-containing protein n=1 Tax=Microvirga sp. 2MCAF35 TaxID=3232987 RepID=UPI003F9DB5A9
MDALPMLALLSPSLFLCHVLLFGAGIRYVGFSYVDNENTLKVPAATVFDAATRYTRDNFTLALNVNNLFDNEYVSSCDTQYTCNYGAGLVATLKASYKW